MADTITLKNPDDFDTICRILNEEPFMKVRGQHSSPGYRSRLYENNLTLELKRVEYIPE